MITLLIAFKLLTTLSFAMDSSPASAEFRKLWLGLLTHSHTLKSEQAQLSQKETSLTRAQLHWLPSLSLATQAFQTDSPGQVLFSKLNSHGLAGSDLAPFPMNNPDPLTVERLTLQARLPIFEGGRGEAERFGKKMESESAHLNVLQTKLELYAGLIRNYLSVQTTEEHKASILKLRSTLQSVIENYHIGSRANPVGYSGLLGLRSLSNRMAMELSSLETNIDSEIRQLTELTSAEIPLPYSPSILKDTDFFDFISERVTAQKLISQNEVSQDNAMSAGLASTAGSLQEFAHAERSRYLPQVGLFAETEYTNIAAPIGASGLSYSTGAYLQWNLLQPTHFGAVKEMELRANAIEQRVDALRQESKIQRQTQEAQIAAIRTQIDLARATQQMLEEQITISTGLFKNGALNALQLTEVFSHGLDILSVIHQQKAQLVEAHLILVQHRPLSYQTEILKTYEQPTSK